MSAAAGAVHAQETTGGIKGIVTSDQGSPVVNAKVTIVHEPTGVTVTTKTDGTGYFVATGLRVGGPYKVSVNASGYSVADTEVAYVNIGEPTEADVSLQATATEVVIKGKRKEFVPGRTTVGSEQIATFPTINRDIRDFAQKSPTAWMDPTNSNALSLGGMNNHSNAILIDGVRTADEFGLNANSMPTQRSMISPDAVEAVNIDIAPYDVQYSNFQGGVVNFVTKSGTNQFHGSAFYEYTQDNLRGDRFATTDTSGNPVTTFVPRTAKEKSIGYTLSGPIIKDRLFFFGLYEKYSSAASVEFGPAGSGASRPVTGITQADVDSVTNILKTQYHYDPLGWQGGVAPITDEKIQTKIDWQINDNHRAVFSYINTKSGRVTDTGNSQTSGQSTLGLMSKWYTLQSNLEIGKMQVLSRWTDAFSTEFNYSHKDVVNISSPFGGTDFAEMKIFISPTTTSPASPAANSPAIFVGPDFSRQANALTVKTDHIDFKGKYRLGAHTLSGGYEHERVYSFNIFVQGANGSYVFNSVADLAAGKAASVTYRNAFDNIKNDGAAQFTYFTNTFYVQDQWRINPRLTVTGGLRYDGYRSHDLPKANASFQTNYGFTNAKGLDGLSVLQPRLSFTWHPKFDETLTIYGGTGKFQGGQENVWVANSYTNTGNLLGSVTCSRNSSNVTSCNSITTPGALDNVDGFNVNSSIKALNAASANAGTGDVNVLSPDFQIPAVSKTSLGLQKTANLGFLGDNYRFTAEVTHAQFDKQVYWRDLAQEHAYSGTAPDGRPEYFGPRLTPATRGDVLIATAGVGFSDEFTVSASKDFRDGWAKGLSIDGSFALNRAREANPGNSSTAASSFRTNYTYDPSQPLLGVSQYQIDKIGKATVNYQRKFWGDNFTRVTFFAQGRSGPRFTYAVQDAGSSFNGANSGASVGMFGENKATEGFNRQLFYVPKADSSGNVTATSDPLVIYNTGNFAGNPNCTTAVPSGSTCVKAFDVAAFNTFLHQSGLIKYAGQIVPRNAFKAKGNFFVNMHLEQEVPAFFPSRSKLIFYMDFQNVTNAINDEWGVATKYNFGERTIVSARNCQAVAQAANNGGNTGGNAGIGGSANRGCWVNNGITNTPVSGNFYQYDSLNLGTKFDDFTTSVYQIKVGVRYKF
jgi:outer membrane receptor for ferrienterochelin and colicin